jgi:hypothetical protein
MPDQVQDKPVSHEEATIPTRLAVTSPVNGNGSGTEKPALEKPDKKEIATAPWLLQQYFEGEIDLDHELAARFPTMPLMSIFHIRTVGEKVRNGIASLSTQDGAATVIMQLDATSRGLHCSLTLGSMLSMRFQIEKLSDMDRQRWLDVMRAPARETAFLWGQSRWESDYLICSVRKYYTSVYTFSPRQIEGGFNLTPEVTGKVLNWLQAYWTAERADEKAAKITTW